MAALYSKFASSIKNDSLIETVKKVSNWAANKLGISPQAGVQKHRIDLSKKLDAVFNSTVRYGPFKGLRLTPNPWWGSRVRGNMLLGLYEKEVLDSLEKIPKKYDTFIDLGAADGYYGVGVLVNNLFQKSICYEMSSQGREVIKNNAYLNNVTPRVEIKGVAGKNFYSEIPSIVLEKSVLFIDIEGAEFELLEKRTFAAFSKSVIIVELHEWLFDDGYEKLEKLKENSMSTHTISELKMGSRDLSSFAELKAFSDNDRWLICSEGRGQLMTWLRFDPAVSHEVENL